jgi:hypothetical protein
MTTESGPDDEPRPPATPRPAPRPQLPTSIWLYIVVVVLIYLVAGLFPGEPTLAIDGRLAVTTFFRLLFVFLLINRSTIGLIIAAVFEAFSLMLLVVTLPDADVVKLGVLMFLQSAALALLLTRATRVFVRSG